MQPPPGRPPRDGSGQSADTRTFAVSTSARGEEDAAVQGTNDDATVSKLCVHLRSLCACRLLTVPLAIRSSCVQLGYWEDPFVSFFVRQPARRPPLINRGASLWRRCSAKERETLAL